MTGRGHFSYLSHLARLGSANVHPGGAGATDRLTTALELRNARRVLEIGCGTAATLVAMASRHDADMEGVDVLPEMLRVAKSRIRWSGLTGRITVRLVNPDAPLPFPDRVFDRAYTESVLGFQDERAARAMLAEIVRILESGGLYAANEAIWKESAPREKIAAINRSCEHDFGSSQASETGWRLKDWLELMRSTGFQVISHELIEGSRPAARWRLSRSVIASSLVTGYHRIKSYLVPGLLKERLEFNRLLKAHRTDGQYIEARLFVLKKP